jgi:hypothetical protein
MSAALFWFLCEVNLKKSCSGPVRAKISFDVDYQHHILSKSVQWGRRKRTPTYSASPLWISFTEPNVNQMWMLVVATRRDVTGRAGVHLTYMQLAFHSPRSHCRFNSAVRLRNHMRFGRAFVRFSICRLFFTERRWDGWNMQHAGER